MRIASRRAFTLIELLAALSISGLVILGAVALLDQVSDSGARIVSRGLVIAREGNGLRVLRQTLLDARTTTDTLDRFRGNERSADFASVCQHPAGWMEACHVSLAVDARRDSSAIIAQLSIGGAIELARYAPGAEFRYFDRVARDSSWLKRWTPSLTLPLAIAVVAGGDSVVFPVGVPRD